MPYGRSDIEQAITNNIKVARTLIRMRHSIQADEELNQRLPAIRKVLESQAANGSVLGLSNKELREILFGESE